jgi:hypothetical protein
MWLSLAIMRVSFATEFARMYGRFTITSRPVHLNVRPVLRNCLQSERGGGENSSNKLAAAWALGAPTAKLVAVVLGWGEGPL